MVRSKRERGSRSFHRACFVFLQRLLVLFSFRVVFSALSLSLWCTYAKDSSYSFYHDTYSFRDLRALGTLIFFGKCTGKGPFFFNIVVEKGLGLTLISFIDVKDVKFVINYDFPTNIEDYVHRVGRTGRGGAKGQAFTFFTTDNARQARDLVGILRETNQVIDPRLEMMSTSSHGGGRGGGRRGGFRGRGGGGYGGYGGRQGGGYGGGGYGGGYGGGAAGRW